VGGDRLTIGGLVDLPLVDLREAYETTLERLVRGEA